MTLIITLIWIIWAVFMFTGLYFGHDARDHERAENGIGLFIISIAFLPILTGITAIWG